MVRNPKIVAVSGGLQRPSRTVALVQQLREGLSDALRTACVPAFS